MATARLTSVPARGVFPVECRADVTREVAATSMSVARPSAVFVALLYLILGVADLGFSLLAFRLGVAEGNPLLAWMEARGLFIPAKLALTGVATGLIAVLYSRDRARALCWALIALMVVVNAYHVVELSARLPTGR